MRKNIIDIYKRNVSGTFVTALFWNRDVGRSKPRSNRQLIVANLFFVGIHFLFLPLTLTFGAGIKTLIDFFSRKEVSEVKINSVIKDIDTLDDETFKGIVQKIITQGFVAKSNTSQHLISSLRYGKNSSMSIIMQRGISPEKRQALLKKASELSDRSSIDSLTEEDISLIISGKSIPKPRSPEEQKKFIPEQKQLIKEYLSLPHNQGKRTLQNLCAFFQPEVPTEPSTPRRLSMS